MRRVTCETDATIELARLADCQQPARIVLLVDQILRFNAGQPSTSVLWVMSVVCLTSTTHSRHGNSCLTHSCLGGVCHQQHPSSISLYHHLLQSHVHHGMIWLQFVE